MWLKRLLLKISFAIAWFPRWSKLYQRILERPWIGFQILPWHRDITPWRAQSLMKVLEWRADGWRELWNAVHHPLIVSEAISWYQPKGAMDCEDFALWAATALDKRYEARVLCVYWSTGRWPWQQAGHAVCLYHDPDLNEYGYIGNWPRKRKLGSEIDAVRSIVRSAGREQEELIGYKTYKPEELYVH
jgi:hypothetical protein